MAKKKADNQDSKNLSFEQAIEALGSIVQDIETGQVPLQESLRQYEKGMSLIAHCRGILEAAEKKIEEIDAKSVGASRRDEDLPEEDEEEEDTGEDEEPEEERESLF